ncbi:hypothetical protein MalM14_22750 [Gimesia chilikensis]|nr:hypothetical protein MalM14_22750 [Gimesia chilikensis]
MDGSYIAMIIIAIAWIIETSIWRGELQKLRSDCIQNGYAEWAVDSKGKTKFQLKKSEKSD